jgi:hypothetical protein
VETRELPILVRPIENRWNNIDWLSEFAKGSPDGVIQDFKKTYAQSGLGSTHICFLYAAELCTISEILGAQRAQNVGQGNLTDP